MNRSISFLCIFALSLLLIASYMNSVTFWNAVISIVAGILAALATAWSIIKFYLDKRIDDATFKQHMEDFENKTNSCFMSFSTKNNEIKNDFNKIDIKLDNIKDKIDNQGKSIAKLEGRIEELSKKQS